ncbi:MAG: cytochrome c oxidase assembly protein [Gammaproteobacteria bacterium]|nr:cytochrome c oxidase assembly protein [Gammaproteobacteria bacterium]MCW5582954.1 cytochrome c oxidase assembly protein [Gammaproteobacteria bacterium]
MSNKKLHHKVFIYGGVAAVIMFTFCFAMVPLYSLICKKTGINTSAANSGLLTAVSAETKELPDLTRTITVQFVAVNHNGLPWEFYPRTKSIQVHPGENNKIYFSAKNTTDKTMSVQAIPSMTPSEALSYFHKIECFCFTQQTLNAKESKEMPMIFRIDNTIPKEIHVITLAYTLFDTTPKETRKG